jgi:RNA polymerase sigma-70 factor (ECF subfamily)
MYERHGATVERWVRRLAGPGAEVEDLVHDVFVIALRRSAEWRGDAKLTTWLFRITDRVVRKRRWRDRLRGWLGGRYRANVEHLTLESPTPLDQLEQAHEVHRLYRALDRLPESYRTVLVLYDLDGRSAEEVGGLLGLAPNTVWVRVHRARAKLLEALDRQGERT